MIHDLTNLSLKRAYSMMSANVSSLLETQQPTEIAANGPCLDIVGAHPAQCCEFLYSIFLRPHAVKERSYLKPYPANILFEMPI